MHSYLLLINIIILCDWPLFSSTQFGNSPLSLAYARGLTDVAQMLIKKGASTHTTEKVWPLIHMKCNVNEGH